MKTKSTTSKTLIVFKEYQPVLSDNTRFQVESKSSEWIGKIVEIKISGQAKKYKVYTITDYASFTTNNLDKAIKYFMKNSEKLISISRSLKQLREEDILLHLPEFKKDEDDDVDLDEGFYFPRRI